MIQHCQFRRERRFLVFGMFERKAQQIAEMFDHLPRAARVFFDKG